MTEKVVLMVMLAHGALGPWDELIFIGVVVVFIGMMGLSWFRSRMNEPEFEDEYSDTITDADFPPDSEAKGRFRLD